jgi:SET domain-containing protein
MIKEKNMYRPLPESLTIKQSKVNGLGLFAQEAISQGTNLGTSHIKINEEIIRTPLGGFINHANEANVVKVELRDEKAMKKWSLVALRDIKKGEELTIRYTFYNI